MDDKMYCGPAENSSPYANKIGVSPVGYKEPLYLPAEYHNYFQTKPTAEDLIKTETVLMKSEARMRLLMLSNRDTFRNASDRVNYDLEVASLMQVITKHEHLRRLQRIAVLMTEREFRMAQIHHDIEPKMAIASSGSEDTLSRDVEKAMADDAPGLPDEFVKGPSVPLMRDRTDEYEERKDAERMAQRLARPNMVARPSPTK